MVVIPRLEDDYFPIVLLGGYFWGAMLSFGRVHLHPWLFFHCHSLLFRGVACWNDVKWQLQVLVSPKSSFSKSAKMLAFGWVGWFRHDIPANFFGGRLAGLQWIFATTRIFQKENLDSPVQSTPPSTLGKNQLNRSTASIRCPVAKRPQDERVRTAKDLAQEARFWQGARGRYGRYLVP